LRWAARGASKALLWQRKRETGCGAVMTTVLPPVTSQPKYDRGPKPKYDRGPTTERVQFPLVSARKKSTLLSNSGLADT